MSMYGLDHSMFDLGFADDPALMEFLSIHDREREEEDLLRLSNSLLKNIKRNQSPQKRRHDGTSPLPLGMDWSPPPSNWNGPNTIWPGDSHTGWSYCVTIPSILSESRGSEPVVFYRVQVGLRSPEGVTTTRGVQRRFSDFLKLSADLKRSFRKKKLPPAPAKGLLRMKSSAVVEERRYSLEDWMAKVLSDIDFSRSAPIAYFLELEAAARASFSESSPHVPDIKSATHQINLSSDSDLSVAAGTSALASNYRNESNCEANDSEPARYIKARNSDCDSENPISDDDLATPTEETVNDALRENNNGASKTDMENLMSRLNQELAVRQYLITEVKDLETELESITKSSKENLEQAISVERERYMQMQWDIQELRQMCMEMESRLKDGQDEKAHAEATRTSIVQESEVLRKELNSAKEQLKNMQKCHEESELKSKSDAKLLIGEVKSLQSSQSELRLELDKLAKENTELEMKLRKEKQERELINAANAKLLHKCKLLSSRLEECSVNFLIDEENKLKMDTYSPSDALGILATSENRVSLYLAEAQFLARDIESPLTAISPESDDLTTTDNELRKMLTDVFIDNAMLRKRVNSITRFALSATYASPDNLETVDEDASSGKTLSSQSLER